MVEPWVFWTLGSYHTDQHILVIKAETSAAAVAGLGLPEGNGHLVHPCWRGSILADAKTKRHGDPWRVKIDGNRLPSNRERFDFIPGNRS